MHFKTKSLVIILIVAVIMAGVGFLVSETNSITGAVVGKCACASDDDCSDSNECTIDSCLYADSCAASRCIHSKNSECS